MITEHIYARGREEYYALLDNEDDSAIEVWLVDRDPFIEDDDDHGPCFMEDYEKFAQRARDVIRKQADLFRAVLSRRNNPSCIPTGKEGESPSLSFPSHGVEQDPEGDITDRALTPTRNRLMSSCSLPEDCSVSLAKALIEIMSQQSLASLEV